MTLHQHWSLHAILMWANNGAADLSFQLLLGLEFGFRESQRLQLKGHWGSKRHEMEISTGCWQPQLSLAAPRRQHPTAVTGAGHRFLQGSLSSVTEVIGSCGRGACWGCLLGYVLLVAALLLTLALPWFREALTSTGVFSSSSPVRPGPTDPSFPESGLQMCAVVDVEWEA